MECLGSWPCQLLKCSDFSFHSVPHPDVFNQFIHPRPASENYVRQKALSERFLYAVARYYEWTQIQKTGGTFEKFPSTATVWGQAVAQLVETLRHKPEGRGVRFPMVSLEFSIDIILGSTQEYFLGSKGGQCVGLTTLPPSWAECLEIWEPQPPWTSPGLYRDSFTFTSTVTLPWSIFHTLNHCFTEYVFNQQWDCTTTVCCNNRYAAT